MFKKNSIIILLSLTAILTMTACNAFLVGSGDIITETVQVSNFDRVALEGSGEVRLTQDGSETLEIETHENIMELIMAEVEDGTLTLGLKDVKKMVLPRRLIFYVSVDDLAGLAVAGSGEIEAETISADQMETSVAGSGRIRISNLAADGMRASIGGSGQIELTGGEAADQDISISGSGNYSSGDVCSASVKVEISGSGKATVCATETLDADISGSGSVDYYGQPAVNISSSGSGGINSLGEK